MSCFSEKEENIAGLLEQANALKREIFEEKQRDNLDAERVRREMRRARMNLVILTAVTLSQRTQIENIPQESSLSLKTTTVTKAAPR